MMMSKLIYHFYLRDSVATNEVNKNTSSKKKLGKILKKFCH